MGMIERGTVQITTSAFNLRKKGKLPEEEELWIFESTGVGMSP